MNDIDHVAVTLRLWRSTPFIYGSADCLLSIGDYIARRGGRDVSSLFRGRYDDEAGALAQMKRYGGATGLIDLTGVPRTGAPVRGDVVALEIDGTMIGALHTGDMIAARLERGVIEITPRFVNVVAAWETSKLCQP